MNQVRTGLVVATTGAGAALVALGVAGLSALPAWTTEAGILLAVAGVAAVVLPAVLPDHLVEVRQRPAPLVPPVTSGPAPAGGDGSG